MFFNILKKDLKRKKTMNIILFLFVVLCTTFLSSSINNLSAVLGAVEYFSGQTNVTDYFLLITEEERVDSWMEESVLVKDGQKEEFLNVTSDSIRTPMGKLEAMSSTMIGKIPPKYNLVLEEDDVPLKEVEENEVAVSSLIAKKNELSVGDSITLSFGDKEKTFTISHIIKDMLFGTEYIDMNRFVISDSDYDYLRSSKEALTIHLYSIVTDDVNALEKDINKQEFSAFYKFDRDTLNAVFTMEMMLASILIIVSTCLIIIALVILRFTIVFTLQDDYKEIGVMKAIGLKNKDIKRIYITKYLALALAGVVIGSFLSIPFGNMMLKDVGDTMAMKTASINLVVHILCGGTILLLVIGFCYLSTGKLNRFTAIQAIRNGSTGERFHNKSRYSLHSRRSIPTICYMAVNSIRSRMRSYGVLVVTFVLGTLLIVLPLNAVNTLNSDEMVELFGTSLSDAYIEDLRFGEHVGNDDLLDYIKAGKEELERLYEESGIGVELYFDYSFLVKVYAEDPNDVQTILAFQSYQYDASDFNFYIEGSPPVLPNEIALTELSMKKLGVLIGDTVNVIIGDKAQQYIVTASFQAMNNMGLSLRFSEGADTDKEAWNITGMFGIQVNFTDRSDIKGQLEQLKEVTPEQYRVKSSKDVTSAYLGGMIDSINSLKLLILIVVLFINCLITVLLMKMFITKETSEIALLKSIGFTEKSILIWQTLRILIVLSASILIGIALSNPLNAVVAKYTFGIMGTPKINLNVIAWEVYLMYPILLFLGTGAAAVLSTGRIWHIHLREVGNLE